MAGGVVLPVVFLTPLPLAPAPPPTAVLSHYAASFYMDGPALSWYQWMSWNGFFPSWQAMLQALESRFVPSFYDDPQGALFKLQ